jgi:hypothetical protein
MSTDVAELLRDALTLPLEARAALADSLLESLDAEIDADAEDAWREEIRLRLNQIDNCAMEMIPWEEARRAIWAKLKH